MFQRTAANGRNALYRVSLDAEEPRPWRLPRTDQTPIGREWRIDGQGTHILLAIGLVLRLAAPASAQGASRRRGAPVLVGIDALRADFRAKSGTDTVFFGGSSAALGAPARRVLQRRRYGFAAIRQWW